MRLLPWSALLLALLPAATPAHNYNYIEAGLAAHEDTDHTDSVMNRGAEPEGYRAAFSLAMPTRPFAYFTEYVHTDVLEHFSVGLLHRRPLRDRLDATAGASVEFEDMTDEKGYGLRAGLRWSPFGPRVELSPELRHEEMFEAQTSVRLALIVQLYRRLHAEVAAQGGDDERYVIGFRYAYPTPAPRY